MAKKNKIFPNSGEYVDGTGLQSLVSNPGQYYKERREDRTGESLLKALQSTPQGFLKEVADSLNPFEEEQEVAKKLEEYNKVLAQEEKAIKEAPVNAVEAEVQQELGPKYSSYKNEKEELKALEKRTYAGLRSRIHSNILDKYGPKENPDDNWAEKAGKSIWGLGTGIVATVNGFVTGAGAKAFDTTNHFTKKEEDRLNYLRDKIHKTELPVLKKQKDVLQKEASAIIDKNNKRLESLVEEHKRLNALTIRTAEEGDRLFEVSREISRIRSIKENYEDALEVYDDAIAGGNFWNGLTKDLNSSLTLGLVNTKNKMYTKDVVEKLKEDPNVELTETEKELLQSAIAKNVANSSGLGSEDYQLGNSVSQSVVFMAEMALVSRLTGGLGGTAEALGTRGLTRFGLGLTEEAASTMLMGSTYLNAMDSYNQQAVALKNEDGSKSFVADINEKKAQVKRLQAGNKVLDSEIANKEAELNTFINENKDIDPTLEKELEELYRKKELVQDNLNELLDEDGKIRNEEVSNLDAVLKGASQNFAERFSERFVGGVADNAFKAVKNRAINNNVVKTLGKTKYGDKIGSAANWVDNKIAFGRRVLDDKFFESTKLGALSKELVTHSGPAKVMHSLPSEMVEEVFTQLTPQYMEDYNKQLNELTDPSFYKQVALSSMIISGGSSAVGLGVHGVNYASRKNYREKYNKELAKRKNVRDIYRRIDEATTDEELAKDIAMNTLGTIFDINEYKARIAELRNPDVEDKKGLTQEERNAKADQLEKTSFFNMAYQAIETGTQRDLKRALTNVKNKENISGETKASVEEAIKKLDNLSEKYSAYRNYINFNTILDEFIKSDIAKTSIASLEKDIAYEDDTELHEDLSRINERNNFELINLEELTHEDIQNNEGLNNQIATYVKESPALAKYIERITMLNSLKDSLKDSQDKLAYETNISNGKEIAKRELDKFKANAIRNTTAENRDEVIENIPEEELDTETIQAINEQAVETNGVEEEQSEEEQSEEENQNTTPKNRRKEKKNNRKRKENVSKINNSLNATDELDELLGEGASLEGFVGSAEEAGVTPENTQSLASLFGTEEENKTSNNKPEEDNSEAINNRKDNLSDSDVFAPIMIDMENDGHKSEIETFAKVFSNMANKGIKPDFDGIIAGLRSRYRNSRAIEQKFNLIAAGFQEGFQVNLSEQEIEDVYINNFGLFDDSLDSILGNSSVNTSATTVPNVKENVSAKEVVESENTNNNSQTPLQIDLKTTLIKPAKVANHTSKNYRGEGLKLGGVLGLEYEENEDGKQTTTNKLNESAKPFIDWRNFRHGSEVEFVFDMDYLLDTTNIMPVWEGLDRLNLTGKDKPFKTKVSVQDRLIDIFKDDPELNSWDKIVQAIKDYQKDRDFNNPLFRHEEFLKIVPIGTVNNNLKDEFNEDGTPSTEKSVIPGGLNDYYWFNTTNVALFLDKEDKPMISERDNRIEKNRRILMEARKHILANGSFKTTVLSKEDKNDNTRLLETEEDKKRGHTKDFYSILGEFDNSIENFEKNATLAVLIGSNFVSGTNRNGSNKIATVGNVEVTRENTKNFQEFIDNATESGFTTGRTVFIHQDGLDNAGNPIFVIRDVINDHDSKQEEFARVNKILRDLYFLMVTDNSVETRKKINDLFKKKFGFSINTQELFNKKFKKAYPSLVNSTKKFRQDLDKDIYSNSYTILPDLSRYTSASEFVEDLLQGNEIATIGKKEMILGNIHTNLIFNPITKNGETIYTVQSQPFAMFAQNFENVSEPTKIAFDKKLKKRLELRKKDIEEKIKEASNDIEKESLEKTLINVNTQLGVAVAKEKQALSPSSLPGNVQDNTELVNNLAESMSLESKEEAKEIIDSVYENFVSLHLNSITDKLVDEGIIEKDC